MSHLTGKRVAILAADGFEQSELLEPMRALKEHAASVDVVSPEGGKVQGFEHFDKGEQVPVDVKLSDADAGKYDALVIPGGLFNPDKLRVDDRALAFTRDFFRAGKPVAAICHAPCTLVEADCVRGKRLTSWPSLQTDIRIAGGEWVDEQVVVDGNLITSRKPDDLAAFNEQLLLAIG